MSDVVVPDWDKLVFYHCGRFSSSRRVETHHHPACELIFFRSGECLNQLDRNLSFPGKTGTILVIPPGTPHRQLNHGRTETMFVTFESGLEEFEHPARIINVEHDVAAERWFDDICRLNDALETGMAEMTKGILFSLLVRLMRLEAAGRQEKEKHPAVFQALRIMENHYADGINVAEIARKCGVSSGYLCSLFQQYLHLSPIQQLNRIRLRAAVQLLRNPYMSVSDAAERCGYTDVNYFIRIFKAKLNCTPSEYRRIEAKRQQDGIYGDKFYFSWDSDTNPEDEI